LVLIKRIYHEAWFSECQIEICSW